MLVRHMVLNICMKFYEDILNSFKDTILSQKLLRTKFKGKKKVKVSYLTCVVDKTKVMTNNPNGFQREIKIKGQRLEEVENFKYLGAIISNEGSKPEILSRTAHTTAALSRLKIIWRDKNISLASKVKLMRTLILSTFVYACES